MSELTRRGLLARAGLAAGALAVGRPELAEASDAAPDLRDWGSVRSQFELDPGRIHLTSFLLATHPRPVRDAIAAHRQRLDANPVEYLHGPGDGLSAAAREAAGRFLGAPASEVALTDSTTMGLGLLYTRLALRPEDEVLTTEHDFYATHESLRLSGARVRRIALYGDSRRASEDEIVSRVLRAVTGRTRVVALTWVHSSTGVRLPVRTIAQALPERVLVCVDGVHGFGANAATVRDLALRRVRLRLPQVALRASRDRRAVGERARARAHATDDPVLRRLAATARGSRAARRAASPTGRPSRRADSTPSSTAGRFPRPSPCTRGSAASASRRGSAVSRHA